MSGRRIRNNSVKIHVFFMDIFVKAFPQTLLAQSQDTLIHLPLLGVKIDCFIRASQSLCIIFLLAINCTVFTAAGSLYYFRKRSRK